MTQLLDIILIGAKELCNADAGTLYSIQVDGEGCPNGLTRHQTSVQARAMGIADVFGAPLQ